MSEDSSYNYWNSNNQTIIDFINGDAVMFLLVLQLLELGTFGHFMLFLVLLELQ